MTAVVTLVVAALFGNIAFCVLRSLQRIAGCADVELYNGTSLLWIVGFAALHVCLRVVLRAVLPSDEDKRAKLAIVESTPSRQANNEDLKYIVDVWKQVVAVQMHFNDMVMRVRNFGLTLASAVVGGAALAARGGVTFTIGGQETNLSSLVLLAGLCGWFAFYLLDRFYYHALLIGAVVQGDAIEEKEKDRLPHLGLSRTITTFSHVKFKCGEGKLRARDKLDIFYLFVASLLAVGLMYVSRAAGAVQP